MSISRNIPQMTRREFLSLPHYPWSIKPLYVDEIFFVQTRRKHDSGYGCFATGALIDGQPYIIGCGHDVLELPSVRVDFFHNNGIIRIYPNRFAEKFKITHRLSSFTVEII